MGLRAFILVGPTAAGKSDVALRIASGGGWAVLSADSMLVYRGMDIGTAKPPAAARAIAPHDGIDAVSPSEVFSAGRFREYALEAISRRTAAGLSVMVAGGTGLYVKALVCGLDSVAADEEVRSVLRSRLETEGVDALAEELRRIDPAACASVRDLRNPRRVIRAIERVYAGGSGARRGSVPEWRGGPAVGLSVEPDELRRRIAERSAAMFRGGLVDEVRGLLAAGNLSDTARKAIGYAEAIDLVAGRCTVEEAVSRTTLRTCRLAKRQRTWFRHQMPVRWVDANDMDVERIGGDVLKAWREDGPTEIEIGG